MPGLNIYIFFNGLFQGFILKECLLFACFQKDFYNQDLWRLIWGLHCKQGGVLDSGSCNMGSSPGWGWVVFLVK